MDILIINPGKGASGQKSEHLGIAYLKSYVVSRGFTADIIDMIIEEITLRDTVNKIIKIKPKALGISLVDASKKKGLALIKSVRRAGYQGSIILGGYFATFSSREILRDFPEIDYVVRGEGELILAELLEVIINKKDIALTDILGLSFRKNSKIIENPAQTLIKNLDILPPPDRKYAAVTIKNKSPLRINATRGCWGKCAFCDIIRFYAASNGKRWRRRSAKNVVDEIEQLMEKFNTNYFIFNDDQFLVKGRRGAEYVNEFVHELESRDLNISFELMCRADTIQYDIIAQLKSAGLKRIFLGLESFDSEQLRRFGKGISVRQNLKAVIILNKLKVDVIASVILADAYTTLGDLVKQLIALFELRRRYFNGKHCLISINKRLEIYRGSVVYQQYRAQGLLTRDDYLRGYAYKLHLGTTLRLWLLTLEENIIKLLFNPGKVLTNLLPIIRLRYHTFKALITTGAKF